MPGTSALVPIISTSLFKPAMAVPVIILERRVAPLATLVYRDGTSSGRLRNARFSERIICVRILPRIGTSRRTTVRGSAASRRPSA